MSFESVLGKLLWFLGHFYAFVVTQIQLTSLFVNIPSKMVLFCPTCSNILSVEEGSGSALYRFACPTCPYVYDITKKVRYRRRYTC